MLYKRFFAFGCSFTTYAWSTWADIISRSYPEIEYYNLAASGAGNQYTLARLMGADQKYNFNKDDLVIVQWGNVGREDRYIAGTNGHVGWSKSGNIYSSMYEKSFIDKYCHPMDFLLRDLASIKAVSNLLQYKQCTYYFIANDNIARNINQYNYANEYNIRVDGIPRYNELIQVYESVLKEIRGNYFDLIYKGDWFNDALNKPQVKIVRGLLIRDCHPSPSEHIQFLETVLPHIIIPEQIKQLAKQEMHIVLKHQPYESVSEELYKLELPLKIKHEQILPYF